MHLDDDTMRIARAYPENDTMRAAQAHLQSDTMRAARQLMDGPRMALATVAAERASALTLPVELARYGATTQSPAVRLGCSNRIGSCGTA